MKPNREHAQKERDIFASNLKRIMEMRGKTQSDIVSDLEITSSTVSDWANAKKYPRVDKMQALADYLGVVISDLREDQGRPLPSNVIPKMGKDEPVSRIACGEPTPYSDEAMQLAQDYDEKLDTWGQKQVRDVADNEILRCEAEKQEAERQARAALQEQKKQMEAAGEIAPGVVEMLVYVNPAAAGTPLYAESDFERLEFPAEDVPCGADFGIRISGKSMEPTVMDGSIVWVRKRLDFLDGTVGVFMLDDSAVCKRFFKEGDKVRLESDNPEFGPVPVTESDTFVPVGEVIGTI